MTAEERAKVCPKCKASLPISQFYKGHSRCKPCHYAATREWQAKNIEKYREIKKAWRRTNKDKSREHYRRSWRKDADKYRARRKIYYKDYQRLAHGKVFKAIARGDLVRPNICSNCSGSDSPIIAHHDDYSKPLEVRWICESCHADHHYKEKQFA